MVFAPYKYKKVRKKREPFPANPLPYLGDRADEQLPSELQGKPVGSDNEARLGVALQKLGKPFIFQFEVETLFSLPGQGKQIDFLLINTLQPVECDSIFHRREFSKQADAQRDAILNDQLIRQGFRPIMRIPPERLESQQEADRMAEEL